MIGLVEMEAVHPHQIGMRRRKAIDDASSNRNLKVAGISAVPASAKKKALQ